MRFRIYLLLPLLAWGSEEQGECGGFYVLGSDIGPSGEQRLVMKLYKQSRVEEAVAVLSIDNGASIPLGEEIAFGVVDSVDAKVNGLPDYDCRNP